MRPDVEPKRGFLERAGRAVFTRTVHYLYEADVSEALPEVRASKPIQITVGGPDDMAELCTRFPRKAKGFRARLKRGETCIVARDNGKVLSYVWLTFRNHRDSDLRTHIKVGSERCVGYDAFTVPEARGFGIRQVLHVEERKLCRARGRKKLVFWLVKESAPWALEKWEQLGLRQTQVAEIRTYRILRFFKFGRTHKLEPGQDPKGGSSLEIRTSP